MMSAIELIKDFLSTLITKVSGTRRACHMKASTNTLHPNHSWDNFDHFPTTKRELPHLHVHVPPRVIVDPWIHLFTHLLHLIASTKPTSSLPSSRQIVGGGYNTN
eukprot:scaffold12631_cov133-Skeletonema_marinoi.AAC.2